MDQFATGLVGTRSPYGIPHSVYSQEHLSGGSSSGSAVAVAAGLVAFSLGTDTAGSGRVPAAFNGIVGLKGSRGLVSCSGVVPACRSLDCVSLFANNVADAETLLGIVAGVDPADPFSRSVPECRREKWPADARFGVPARSQLEFFGDSQAADLFEAAVRRLTSVGYKAVEIDFSPFSEAASLLYSGPWVAERLAAIEGFLERHRESVHPVVREIICGGRRHTAVDAFRAQYRLEELKKRAAHEWTKMDFLLLPTTGTIYTIDQVLRDPVQLNANLGYYTNFVNLMDLCGIALPAGIRSNTGLPLGVTILGQAFTEDELTRIARRFTGEEITGKLESKVGIRLAVAGAHLSGQPLNSQLTSRGAVLEKTCRTSGEYRIYSLANTEVPKPGIVRDPGFAGPGIEVEIWRLTTEAFGDFVASVPAPMAIGNLKLDDGSTCKGFLCEPCALQGATEITSFAGWRAWLGSRATSA